VGALLFDRAWQESECDGAYDDRDQQRTCARDQLARRRLRGVGAVEDEYAADAGVDRADPPVTGTTCAICPIRNSASTN
jgi:hypothetical protein